MMAEQLLDGEAETITRTDNRDLETRCQLTKRFKYTANCSINVFLSIFLAIGLCTGPCTGAATGADRTTVASCLCLRMMFPIGWITSSPMLSTSSPMLITPTPMLTVSAPMLITPTPLLSTSAQALTTIGPLIRYHCRARDRRNLRPHPSPRRKKRPRLIK